MLQILSILFYGLSVVVCCFLGLFLFVSYILGGVLSKNSALSHIPGPKQHWLLGNIDLYRTVPLHKLYYNLQKEFGDVIRIRLSTVMYVFVAHAQTTHQLLKSGPEALPKAVDATVYKVFRKITKSGLPSLLTAPDDDYWRAVRRAVSPSFSASNLKSMHSSIVESTHHVIDYLHSVGPTAVLEMDDVTQRLTVDVLGHFMFATDWEATKMGECDILICIRDVLKTIQAALKVPYVLYQPWCKPWKKFLKVVDRYDALAEKYVLESKKNPPPPNALMSYLMACIDPETKKPLNIEQLKSEVAFLLFAGFETTARSIAFSLMSISSHPEIEARVEAELDAAGLLVTKANPKPRKLVWDDMSNLKYLNACITESLRMFPVSLGTYRKANRDVEVCGKIIPKGQTIGLPFYAMQRCDANWPDGNKYKPERWLEEEDADILTGGEADGVSKKKYGWLPFSEGPRNCVGMNLSLVELRTTLAMLLSRFRFRLTEEMGGFEGVDRDTQMEITLRAGPGLMMNVIPRE